MYFTISTHCTTCHKAIFCRHCSSAARLLLLFVFYLTMFLQEHTFLLLLWWHRVVMFYFCSCCCYYTCSSSTYLHSDICTLCTYKTPPISFVAANNNKIALLLQPFPPEMQPHLHTAHRTSIAGPVVSTRFAAASVTDVVAVTRTLLLLLLLLLACL